MHVILPIPGPSWPKPLWRRSPQSACAHYVAGSFCPVRLRSGESMGGLESPLRTSQDSSKHGGIGVWSKEVGGRSKSGLWNFLVETPISPRTRKALSDCALVRAESLSAFRVRGCPAVQTHRAKIDPGAPGPRGSRGVQTGPKVSTREHACPYRGGE